MRDFIDEIFEVETLSPPAYEMQRKKECHSSCQCQKCKDKRYLQGKNTHSNGCGCQRCQKNEMKNENEESWLDSLLDWGSNYLSNTSSNLNYTVTPGEDYGSKFGNNRPPGLPAWVRKASTVWAALPFVKSEAQRQGLGETFVKTIVQMAKTESKGRFALPANKFNNDPPNKRGEGESLTTAWGVFQFNRDAWTCLIPLKERSAFQSFRSKGDAGCGGCRGEGGCVYPWDSTVEEEINRPIKRYAELFQDVKNVGGSDKDGAIGLRLWHISPYGWYRPWLEKAKNIGFSSAWSSLDSKKKSRVNSFLKDAEIAQSVSAELDFEPTIPSTILDEILFELNSKQLSSAVDFNRRKGPELGWVNYFDDIVAKVLKLNYSPDEQAFAEAVAEWQLKNGLSVDGWLGNNTWKKMKSLLGLKSKSSTPTNIPSTGKIDPKSCTYPVGSRSTRTVAGGKIFSEYLQLRSAGIHKGIDVSISSSGNSKFDSKRGTPVYASLKPFIDLADLKAACTANSNSYNRGLPISGAGQANLEYATVRIPQESKCGKGSKGGYGCTGDNAYGGVVGLACVYSYRKPDGITGYFTLYLEYLHLVLLNYLPYFTSGGRSYKMSYQEWMQHPNAKNIGVGPLMVHGAKLSASQLTAGNILIGYFGATTWPHVHIQAAFSSKIELYKKSPRIDPMLMIN